MAPRARALRAAVGLLLLAACGLCVFEAVTLEARVSLDVAMYLHTGSLVVAGQVPYVDFDEINLPFVMDLCAASVAAARAIGVGEVPFFQFAVVAAVVASAFATAHAARLRLELSLTGAGVVAAILVLGSCSLFYIPEEGHLASHFGQREHLFALALVPAFAGRWAEAGGRAPGRAYRATAGAFLGAAMLLKPHFVPVVLLCEGHWAVRARSLGFVRSLGTLALAGSAVASLVVVAAITPVEAWGAYLHRWAPLVGRTYEQAYGVPLWEFVRYPSILLGTLVFAVLVAGRRRWPDLMDWATPLALAILLALAQHKAWPYQRIPMNAIVLVVGALAVAGWAARAHDRSGVRELVLLAACAPALAGLVWLGRRARERGANAHTIIEYYTDRVVERIERRTDPGAPVLFLSTAPYPAYPASLLARSAPGSRYLWTFPIALFHPRFGPGGGAAGPQEQQFLAELDADIRRRRPAMIFIDATAPAWGMPAGASVAGYIRGTPVFDAIRSNYRRHSDLGLLEVWERDPAP